MARSLTEIYAHAKETRDQYLQLTEFQNDSKMSVLDAFTYVAAAGIWTFENLLDVFKVDVASDLQGRINGTSSYYANALLKYQSGDELLMNDEGTAFGYANEDTNKRIITRVSYSEYDESDSTQGIVWCDKALLLKIATGEPGNYRQIDGDELLAIRNYVDQISFAGTHTNVVSRKGDVLIPRVTVYYDGAVSADEMHEYISQSLNEFIEDLPFDGVIYAQEIIDAIQDAEHVLDVHISRDTDLQGIFYAEYDDDNNLIPVEEGTTNYEHRVDRFFVPNSGYVRESTGIGTSEEGLQTWKEAITLVVEQYGDEV